MKVNLKAILMFIITSTVVCSFVLMQHSIRKYELLVIKKSIEIKILEIDNELLKVDTSIYKLESKYLRHLCKKGLK